jgi:hypothetical protein
VRWGGSCGDKWGNLTNLQCKATGNCHNESLLCNKYMLEWRPEVRAPSRPPHLMQMCSTSTWDEVRCTRMSHGVLRPFQQQGLVCFSRVQGVQLWFLSDRWRWTGSYSHVHHLLQCQGIEWDLSWEPGHLPNHSTEKPVLITGSHFESARQDGLKIGSKQLYKLQEAHRRESV